MYRNKVALFIKLLKHSLKRHEEIKNVRNFDKTVHM